MIDVSRQAAANADYRLGAADVKDWEKATARSRPARSCPADRLGTPLADKKTYLGDDTPGDASHLHFPSYGPDAAELLVTQAARRRPGRGHGLDRSGDSKDFPVHRLANGADVPGLENLASLEELPETAPGSSRCP